MEGELLTKLICSRQNSETGILRIFTLPRLLIATRITKEW